MLVPRAVDYASKKGEERRGEEKREESEELRMEERRIRGSVDAILLSLLLLSSSSFIKGEARSRVAA